MSLDAPVMAFATNANTNADLIVQARRLGYLSDDDRVLDPTYGLGRFWSLWRPRELVGSDLVPSKSPVGYPVDFTDLPWDAEVFDVVTLDGPYKLNGTSTGAGPSSSDVDYGVERWLSWHYRHALICDGIDEAMRVVKPGGFVLIKCQDQVCGGKVRWQTREFSDHAERIMSKDGPPRARLVDQLHLPSYRPQPAGRSQQHARRNYSTLLVTQKGPSYDRRASCPA